MKRVNMIFGTLILLVACYSAINAQTDCKVLKPEIAGSYVGSCKQGLADGMGEATGEDFYKGEFVKGLPDGEGNYVWKNGATYKGQWKKGFRDGNGTYSFRSSGKDSTLTGKWKNDKYVGNPNSTPYVIEYRNSIGRVSCARVGDRPYVKYKFTRNGGELNSISNLLMQGSSGSESNSTAFTGFEYVTFPFKGKVNFNAPSAFQTSMLTCELRLTISEPGSWVVTIFY
jgi:hypothetical protein